MRAEEKYPDDYLTLMMLGTMVRILDARDELAFAVALEEMWNRVLKVIPPEAQLTPACLTLDTYFRMHGDLRKGLAIHCDNIVKVVGYEAHRDAMERVNKAWPGLIEAALKRHAG